MTIRVNGDVVDNRGAVNVSELVERFGLQPQSILIEHNGLALHRSEWDQRRIADGDRVELIRVVAGG